MFLFQSGMREARNIWMA